MKHSIRNLAVCTSALAMVMTMTACATKGKKEAANTEAVSTVSAKGETTDSTDSVSKSKATADTKLSAPTDTNKSDVFTIESSAASDASASDVGSSDSSGGATITDDDRALLKKTLAQGKLDPATEKCALERLESQLPSKDYLTLARSKKDEKIDPELEQNAGAIIIGCSVTFDPTFKTVAPPPTAETTAPSTEPFKQTVGTKDDPIPLGASVTLPNGFAVVFNSYNPKGNEVVKAASDYAGLPPAGKQFVVYNMTITNVSAKGDKAIPSDNLSFKNVPSNGVPSDRSSCSETLPTPIELYEDLFKGNSVTGNQCMAVLTADAKAPVLYIDVRDETYNDFTFYFRLT